MGDDEEYNIHFIAQTFGKFPHEVWDLPMTEYRSIIAYLQIVDERADRP